jgi:hypothetical protein
VNVRIVGVMGVLVLLGGAAWWLAMVTVDEVDEPCLTLDEDATSVPLGGSPWEAPSGAKYPGGSRDGALRAGGGGGRPPRVSDRRAGFRDRQATGRPVRVRWCSSATSPESGAVVAEEGILGDVEGWLRRSGSRYRTDARGIARVWASREGFVGAGRGGLWGQTRVSEPEEDVRIAIEPRRDVGVLVVDEAGCPVAGVPVAIGAAEDEPRR